MPKVYRMGKPVQARLPEAFVVVVYETQWPAPEEDARLAVSVASRSEFARCDLALEHAVSALGRRHLRSGRQVHAEVWLQARHLLWRSDDDDWSRDQLQYSGPQAVGHYRQVFEEDAQGIILSYSFQLAPSSVA